MTMLSKTRASLKAAGLLENPEYEAACELALTYARQIDRGVKAGGQDATKALYLGPHLLKTMSELGLTPGALPPRPRGRPRKEDAAKPEGSEVTTGSEEGPPNELAAARERHRRRGA